MPGSGVNLYVLYLCRTEGCPGNQDAEHPVLSANSVTLVGIKTPFVGPNRPVHGVGLGQGLTREPRVCGQVSEPG